jgi:hypothetical protein
MNSRRIIYVRIALVTGILLLTSAYHVPSSTSQTFSSQPTLGAGFRYSPYGPPYNPGPAYWAGVGQHMAARFPNAVPQSVWIVSTVNDTATYLTFPATSDNRNVTSSPTDDNEAALTLFDHEGVQVWLQVEPGDAPVEELIHLVLTQYGHHACVVGVGVDVEWYQSHSNSWGKAVTDADAEAWLAAARSYNPNYRLFLKHWEIEKMPPTTRDGILFVNDGQGFASLDEMAAAFAVWGKTFAPGPVAFQYGYPANRPWWQQLNDPPADIGRRILADVPNTQGLFWVDFTVLEVFPP